MAYFQVETLRGAIDYIRQLQKLLDETPPIRKDDRRGDEDEDEKTKMHAKLSTKGTAENLRSQIKTERGKRRGSLSSEQSPMSNGTLSDSDDDHFVKRQRVH